MAVDQCFDIGGNSPYWRPVQWASLYGAMPGIKISRSAFGGSLPVKLDELRSLLAAAAPARVVKLPDGADGQFITKGDFIRALSDAGLARGSISPANEELMLSRGEAALYAFELMLSQRGGPAK